MKYNLIAISLISILITNFPIKSNDLFDNQKDEMRDIPSFEDNSIEEDENEYFKSDWIEPERTIDEIIDEQIAEGMIEVSPKPVIKDMVKLVWLKNWSEIIIYLIDRGLDVNTRYYLEPDKYVNLLMIASMHDKMDLVEHIVEKGANVNEPSIKGYMPLFGAVGSKNKQMVEFLLNKGALINHVSEDGKTPLCIAIDSKSEELVEWLIEKGADINLKNEKGNLALQCAMEYKNKEGIEILLRKGLSVKNETYVLNLAIGNDGLDIAKLLIESGVDINLPDNDGNIPLGVACEVFNDIWPCLGFYRKLDEIIKLLVDKGASIHVKVGNEYPFLMFVAHDIKTAELFLQKGANPNAIIEKWNISLLSFFVERNWVEPVKLLLKYGADVNLKLPLGRTPLFYAKDSEMVDLLISNGADVNYADPSNATPLSSAVYSNNTEVFKALLAKGADATAGIFFGRSMIAIARYNGNTEIFELLKEYDPESFKRFSFDIFRAKRRSKSCD